MEEYVDKLLEDCFKGIRVGFADKDVKKVWRSWYRIRSLITDYLLKEGENPENEEDLPTIR